MLLTDGSPNSPGDLQNYESDILDVSSTEGIPLDAKLDLATEEISEDILNMLLEHERRNDPTGLRRRTIGVSDVVVTAPLKRWHALHTLAVFYRDAFSNQLNDRYEAKLAEYRALSKGARDRTYGYGIGLSLDPIPEAPAPTFSLAAGANPDTIYYAQVSWVSASGQEGTPSEATTYESPANSLLVVTAVNPPAIATGFNVYLGLSANALALQNAAPVPAGESFTAAAGALLPGRAPGTGQAPDIYITGGPLLRRG